MTNTAAPTTPVEIDTRLAEADQALSKARIELARAQKDLERLGGESLTNIVGKAHLAVEGAKRLVSDLNCQYTGWSRFFIVPGGHIHSSTHCQTCFPTTGFGWLPELSGLTEAEAVAEYGGILCSICYPSAPVEWTAGENKKDRERKDAEAALKAITKSPEGKRVVSAAELVRSKTYRIGRYERDIAHFTESAADGLGDIPLWVALNAQRAEEELPKLRKQLDRAIAKHAQAVEALEAALQS